MANGEQSKSNAQFSVRAFLRDHEALLVHFSTPMSEHEEEFPFPTDLENAKRLRDKRLSFSTFQRTSLGPFEEGGEYRDIRHAEGSIGLVVDITEESVLAVDAGDSGTTDDPHNGDMITGGLTPNQSNCDLSINPRNKSNEWVVQNYIPIGILYLQPAYARKRMSIDTPLGQTDVTMDVRVPLCEILLSFPSDRIFTISAERFMEFKRDGQQWVEVTYAEIVPV